jgi:hypothetical protein
MIKTSSQSRLQLSKFPLADLYPSNLKEVLQNSSHWVLPQITALLARVLVPKKVGSKFSFRATIQDLVHRQQDLKFDCGNPIGLEHLKGIFQIVKASPRGSSLGSMKQIGDGIRYASNVPLALAALKQYKSIKYAEWDWTEPERAHLLDPQFFEYSGSFNQGTSWNRDDLITFREQSMVVKSGEKAGQSRTLGATTSIVKTGVTEFDELPKLTKLSLCQTWIFQPQVYHDLMIVNINDLDSPATPLVDTEVVHSVTAAKTIPKQDDWDWLTG